MVVSFSFDADDAGTPNGEDLCAPAPNAGAGDGDPVAPNGLGEGALLGDAPPAMENPRPISGGFDTAEGEPARTPDGDAPPPKEEKPVPVPYDPPIAPISCAPVAIARGFARFEVPRLGEAPWSVSNKDAEVPPGAAVDVGPGAKFQVAHRVSHMRHTMTDPDRVLPDTGDLPRFPSVAVSQPHNAKSVAVSAASPAPSTSSSIRFAAPGGAPTCTPTLFILETPDTCETPAPPAPSSMAATVVVFGRWLALLSRFRLFSNPCLSSASETRGNLARDIGHVVPFQAHSCLCFESRVANTLAAIFAASSRVAFSGILRITRAPHDSHSIVSLATLAQPLRAHGTGAIEGGLANHVPVLNVASLR
mmetsp:Transcript_11433/g.49273  ORF Transcript_11433/g.49273 Transcript_11433/m.49273 type:complete len:363 (-) Transcript_11433:262-1350(-)